MGRTGSKRTITGMSQVGKDITELLKKADCEVTFLNARDEGMYGVKQDKPDIIWFYEDTALTWDHLFKLSELYRHKVPLVFNSMYTYSEDSKKSIIAILNRFHSKGIKNIFAGVFTEEARNSFGKYKPFVAVLPTTIKLISMKSELFKDRSGIMLGEFNKFNNPVLTGGLDIYRFVKKLVKAFPGIDLFAYRHFKLQEAHRLHAYNINGINSHKELDYVQRKVKIIEYTPDLIHTMNTFRAYVSVVTNETFAMVPAEVQASGIPVLYRDMPQSLTPHLYYSGYVWDNTNDLINALKNIYYDEKIWNTFNRRSLKNYEASCENDLQYLLRFQLDKIIIRYKGMCK